MADKEIVVTPEQVTVTHNFPPDAKGNPQSQKWTTTPDQAAKHIPTWNDQGTRSITKGDESAIKDCANEYVKQINS